MTEQQDQYSQQREENSSDINDQMTETVIENINLKTIKEWSEEELGMIEDINDNTARVANFIINLLKH